MDTTPNLVGPNNSGQGTLSTSVFAPYVGSLPYMYLTLELLFDISQYLEMVLKWQCPKKDPHPHLNSQFPKRLELLCVF